jgi:hypothetical protein
LGTGSWDRSPKPAMTSSSERRPRPLLAECHPSGVSFHQQGVLALVDGSTEPVARWPSDRRRRVCDDSRSTHSQDPRVAERVSTGASFWIHLETPEGPGVRKAHGLVTHTLYQRHFVLAKTLSARIVGLARKRAAGSARDKDS